MPDQPSQTSAFANATESSERSVTDGPLSIEVTDLKKWFRIPEHRIDSIKERAVHPFRQSEYRELKALDGISFNVHRGEFFGIVGRNGSGKSTLLKVLASIYRADSGRIRLAGKLAPFIELGVGFNMDLSARENIVLNAVMMGMTREEARGRIDSVLEFAELEEFDELKLKNFSSGMLVRLAFATMLEADADVMLIDEVLAVGDAAFAQKCMDAFTEMRNSGRTVVLVTHDMASVEKFCDRAMLLQDGEIRILGDPEEVGREYMRLNFENLAKEHDEKRPSSERGARMRSVWLENEQGERVTNLAVGERVRMQVEIEAVEDIPQPLLGCVFANSDQVHVLGFSEKLKRDGEEMEVLEAGSRFTFSTSFENVFSPDRYNASFRLCRQHNPGDVAMQLIGALDFVVYGLEDAPGALVIEMDHELTFEEGGES